MAEQRNQTPAGDNTQWTTIIRPRTGWFDVDLEELWRYHDLIVMFVKRNFTVMYKQTILGPLWIILNPLITTVLFNVVFGGIAGLSTDGTPSFLFYMAGNTVWTFFASCINGTANTFVANSQVFGKVYFPRLTTPISQVLTSLINFFIQFVMYILFWVYFAVTGSGVHLTAWAFAVPLVVLDVKTGGVLAAAAGTIGIIIPPSIPLVIYGVVVGASIGELFIAGIIPGIIMGVAILIVCYVISKKKGYRGTAEKLTLKSFSHSFVDAIWAFMAPGIILGGIYWGICTPTEAAVIAVLYSLFTGVVIYRELTFAKIYDAFVETLTVNGATTFMVGLSMAFASYLIMAGLPQQIASFLISITDSRIVLFMIVNLFLLAVGSLIDPIPAIIILAPILLPVMTKFGMSPVTFGVVLVANLAIGYITPPYGVNLFVAMAVAKIPMERMFKYIVALFLAMLAALMLITYCDSATMHLVRFLK